MNFRVWNNELEKELFTPEEIKIGKQKAALLEKYLVKEQQGYITHDEAMIELFTENPEYAEELLGDVIYGGDIDNIRKVWEWHTKAKERSFEMLAQA